MAITDPEFCRSYRAHPDMSSSLVEQASRILKSISTRGLHIHSLDVEDVEEVIRLFNNETCTQVVLEVKPDSIVPVMKTQEVIVEFIASAIVAFASLAFVTKARPEVFANTARDTTPNRWHQTWVDTGKTDFLCGGSFAKFMAPPGKPVPAKLPDCNATINDLLFGKDNKGYWAMDQYIDTSDRGPFYSYKIYGYGTCRVWALSIVDQEIQ
ncbi:hypothetical protein HD806DRAFT_535531 [Xylariaceae sp. AK1471]|nr:hypothetical protein HD806DRAFT_535531 [Xylariaceae sp. AK1471]